MRTGTRESGKGWQVRVAPDVTEFVDGSARRHGDSLRLATRFHQAMSALASQGTRANGAKKLKSMDLWEIRVGDHRAYFCLVPDTNELAVGAFAPKRTRKQSPRTMKGLEMKTHRWRDRVGGTE